MASQVRVILDDNTGDIHYGGGGEWTLSTLVQWYQGTSNYPGFTGNGSFGTLTLAFSGTSVAFIGNTPEITFSQSATVSIDGGAPYSIAYPSAFSYIQWYQSPILSDGQHTITVDHLDSTAVDMVIMTVGPATSLTNRKIFVDNNDPAIQYTGNWTESSSRFDTSILPDGFPVGNTTQRSTTAGDMMTFHFSGTSISVYGIFSWINIGSVSVAYTLDGAVEMQSYPVTESSPQHTGGDGDASNFLFFDKDSIPAGNHTLIINIVDIMNQIFIFDYMVYSPSFSSLATMPNLTSSPTTPSVSSSTSKPSSDSNSSTTMHTAIGEIQMNHKANGTLISAIVGGAVASVLLLIILYMCKKSSNGKRAPPAQQGRPISTYNNAYPQMSDFSVAHPTCGHSASLRGDITPFHMNPTPTSFASVSELKRNRMEQDPPGGGASTSLDIIQRNNPPSDLNSVPPAYEALLAYPATLR